MVSLPQNEHIPINQLNILIKLGNSYSIEMLLLQPRPKRGLIVDPTEHIGVAFFFNISSLIIATNYFVGLKLLWPGGRVNVDELSHISITCWPN